MTVEELISALQQEDPSKEVHFAYDYGDYWHTTEVRYVTGLPIAHNEYHRMPKIEEETEDGNAGSDVQFAVVLSAKVL